MDLGREPPDPQLEQQRELERQQERSLHIEKHTPQVMQQLEQELINRPELAHIISKLPDEQQQQLKDQITEAAFKGCGPNIPKIDAIIINKQDGSLCMQANQYFMSTFNLPDEVQQDALALRQRMDAGEQIDFNISVNNSVIREDGADWTARREAQAEATRQAMGEGQRRPVNEMGTPTAEVYRSGQKDFYTDTGEALINTVRYGMYKTDEEINQWGEQLQQARKEKGVTGVKEHLTKDMPGNWMKEATATILGGFGAKFFMRKAMGQAETKVSVVNATEVGKIVRNREGQITKEILAKPDANEIRGAQGMSNIGYDVKAQATASDKGISGKSTADLAVKGVGQMDVYTPRKMNADTITKGIEAKRKQAEHILIQADLPEEDMSSIALRTWGKKNTQEIKSLFFQKSDGTIIRYNRPKE